MSSPASDRNTKLLEITAAIILSLATLLTAWSSFQAAQWTRTQAIRGNAVVAKLLEGNRYSALSSQDVLIDVIIFSNWLEATNAEDQPLADFYRSRFRAEFKPAFEAWVDLEPLKNPQAPSSPFAMPEYNPANRQAASEIQNEAGELQAEVRVAADNAAFYVRNTLFLASALFFVGLSRMFYVMKVRGAIVALAVVLLLIGLFNVVSGPVG